MLSPALPAFLLALGWQLRVGCSSYPTIAVPSSSSAQASFCLSTRPVPIHLVTV